MRMTSEPARRISACSRPTAFVSASSERKELEQTSSAKPPVLCAGVITAGPHLVQHDRNAGLGELPGGLRAGEAGADDVDGVCVDDAIGADMGRAGAGEQGQRAGRSGWSAQMKKAGGR